MKLWHDDIRPAPEGWEWARTNAEAVELLTNHEVDEISMDHDLGLDFLEPSGETIVLRGSSPDGTGYDLARWMAENGKLPAKIRVHSWSPGGAQRIANALLDGGAKSVEIRPYDMREGS